MAVVMVLVSSTPCGVAAVDNSGFIHPLWCGCGAGDGGGNGYKASASCKGQPPWHGPVACGLSVVYMKVLTGFIMSESGL